MSVQVWMGESHTAPRSRISTPSDVTCKKQKKAADRERRLTTIQSAPAGRAAQSCLRVFRLGRTSGEPTCHLGYLPTELVSSAFDYDNVVLEIVEFAHLSPSAQVRAQGYAKGGLAWANVVERR